MAHVTVKGGTLQELLPELHRAEWREFIRSMCLPPDEEARAIASWDQPPEPSPEQPNE
jgi:hypothetical protein